MCQLTGSLSHHNHQPGPPAQPDAQQPISKLSKVHGLTGLSRATGAISNTCFQLTHGEGMSQLEQ